MAQDRRLAMAATRRKTVDCAFEAVESIGPLVQYDLKGLVVVVAAIVTLRHGPNLPVVTIIAVCTGNLANDEQLQKFRSPLRADLSKLVNLSEAKDG